MIFQHTIDKVLSGEKTQTRRLALPEPNGETAIGCEMLQWPNGSKAVMRGAKDDSHWIPKYQVGKTYAIQPGRGQKATGRICITDIRREDVRNISFEDSISEGFGSQIEFLERWVSMHDSTVFYIKEHATGFYSGEYRIWAGRETKWQTVTLNELLTFIAARPDARYQAWALTFELVRP